MTMEQSSTTTDSPNEGGPCANILPIPPALEFPLPESSAQSSRPSSMAPHHASVPSRNPITEESTLTAAAKDLATPDPTYIPKASRPRGKRRSMTDRPIPAQTGSLLRMRRGQTRHSGAMYLVAMNQMSLHRLPTTSGCRSWRRGPRTSEPQRAIAQP